MTSSIRKVSFAPKFRYENESEVIFALPSLQLALSTEHDLPMTSMIAKYLSKVEQKAPNFVLKPSNHTVDITFISDFDDSLTVNVSLIIYLHDLVLNYMKEKEASVTGEIFNCFAFHIELKLYSDPGGGGVCAADFLRNIPSFMHQIYMKC